jgi:hypothetical protein
VKAKRSSDDSLIRLHLKPFFGACLLTEIERESLTRYVDHRSAEPIVRDKNGRSKKLTARGTISNELSLLRRMLRTAAREGYRVNVPSFEDLIVKTGKGRAGNNPGRAREAVSRVRNLDAAAMGVRQRDLSVSRRSLEAH